MIVETLLMWFRQLQLMIILLQQVWLQLISQYHVLRMCQ